MGKAKRFNSYDDAVAEKRKIVQGFGLERQKLSGIGSTFRSPALQPPVATNTEATSSSGGSGGSGNDFTTNAPTLETEPTTTKCDTDTYKVFTFTLTKDITLEFQNPPSSGVYRLIKLIIDQDGTGGHAVTFPASVSGTPTISSGANERTEVALYTENGGTTYYFMLHSGNVTGGGSGNQTPWLQNVDADNFDLTDIRNLRFGTGGQSHPTEPHIYADASGDLVSNVATGDQWFKTINGVTRSQLTSSKLELRSTSSDSNDIELYANIASPTANDVIGKIIWKGEDDLGAETNYVIMEAETEDPTNTSLQAHWKLSARHDNLMATILDYEGDTATFKFSSGVDIIRPNQDNAKDLGTSSFSWKDLYIAGYEDVKQISVPSNPASGTRRIFTDSATGELSVRTNSGTTVSLEGGGLGSHNILDSSSHSDVTAGTVVRGDLITGQGATPKWTRLAKGSANQVLTMDGSGTDITWANAATGDDLGDHTATQNLNLDGNDMINGGEIKLSSTNAIGGSDVGISQVAGDMYYNALTTDSHFFREQGTTVVEIDVDGVDIRSGWLEMTEITAPSGLTNHIRLFAEDNGSGKTRLMCQFGSGSAQQIAIEP